MFINLKKDPRILRSSPCHTCVNLPPPIVFRLPFMSALGCYSDSRSCPCSDAPWTPTHVHTRTLLGLLPTTPLRAPCLSALQILGTPLGRLLRHPLGHPCLNSSYKSEPTPSDPVQTSILVRVTIQTLAIQLRSEVHSGVRSDIHVSLHLTSLSPCLWDLLRPPSLSTLRVPCRSELLVTHLHKTFACSHEIHALK
jgi:hypothetical protein